MALTSLKSRINRLEAKHKTDASRVIGVIGSRFGHMIVDPDKPGHLKFSQPPDGFDAWALQQQRTLQAKLATLWLANAPRNSALNNVGTLAKKTAPQSWGRSNRTSFTMPMIPKSKFKGTN